MQIISGLKIYLSAVSLLLFMQVQAQPITGIWKGKMGSSRVELKLIRKGDSLIGTSYYYDSKSNYRRYSVKGYFDDQNNDVIWWDDSLVEHDGTNRFIGTGPQSGALLAVADFNCPGEGVMKLDGKSSRKDDQRKDQKELHLLKSSAAPNFPDEWDFLINNYAYGVSHPEIVDSIERISSGQASSVAYSEPVPYPVSPRTEPPPLKTTENAEPTVENKMTPPLAQTNEQKFTTRTKILQQVIPVKGDSIEIRFYDNAEIDGDSIAVFLNGQLLQEHILLAEQAYVIKIATKDLQADNELVMVAENLGSIPPNTSLMVAVVDDKRYEAHLRSTEGSSALVRLVKP